MRGPVKLQFGSLFLEKIGAGLTAGQKEHLQSVGRTVDSADFLSTFGDVEL
jgi:hypothetical protein